MAFRPVIDWQIHDDAGRRKYLSEAERWDFLTAVDQLPNTSDRLLCKTLVFTGCRISEALGLRPEHVDATRLTVTMKTLKRRRIVYRVIPIPPSLVVGLVDLPAAADGRFWDMHRATAWRLIKGLMDTTGIVGPMACARGLRHGYGIFAAGHSVPLNLIQRWMGHSSSSTTAIYLDAVGREERAFAARMWNKKSVD